MSVTDLPSTIACVVGFFLFALLCYYTKPRQSGALRRAQALEAWNSRQRQGLSDPTARDKVIQRSLLVQRVIAKEGRTLTLGPLVEDEEEDDDDDSHNNNNDPIDESDHPCSVVEENEEESDCAICLEPFRVGDVVAWSREEASACHHPFHRECILLWFTKHNDCPKCREPILKPENQDEDVDAGNENNMEQSNTVFVIFNSLVAQARRTSFSLAASTFDVSDDSDNNVEDGEQHALYKPKEDQPLPFRRVVSFGDALKPPASASRRRRASFSIAAAASCDVSEASVDDEEDDILESKPSPFRRVVSYGDALKPPAASGCRRRKAGISLASSTVDVSETSEILFDEDEEDSLCKLEENQPSPFRRVVSEVSP